MFEDPIAFVQAALFLSTASYLGLILGLWYLTGTWTWPALFVAASLVRAKLEQTSYDKMDSQKKKSPQ